MEYPNWTRERQYAVDLQLAKERMSEQRIDRTELRGELIDWITKYKDAAERNALAEDPDESADYLIALIDPLIEEANDRAELSLSMLHGKEVAINDLKCLLEMCQEHLRESRHVPRNILR